MINTNNLFEQIDASKTQFYVSEQQDQKTGVSSLEVIDAEDAATPSEESSDTPPQDSLPDSSLSPDELRKELDIANKRYRDLQSFKDKQIKDLKDKLKDSAKTDVKLPKTEAEIEEFKKSNEEAWGYIESIVQLKLLENNKQLEEQFTELKQSQEALAKQKAAAEFNKYHPDIDLDALPSDPKFIKWFQDQTPDIQELIQKSNNPVTFARLITIYKQDVGIVTKDKKADKLDATKTIKVTSKVTPASDGKKTWSWAEIKSMSQSQYEKHEAEIDEAVSKGLVTP